MTRGEINTLIDNYIEHIRKRKTYYFGKDEELYNRYDCQYILLLDLKAHMKNGNIDR